MSLITKRRLASLVSASAMVATLAVAIMPSGGPREPQLFGWRFGEGRLQRDPEQGNRECPELRVPGLLHRRARRHRRSGRHGEEAFDDVRRLLQLGERDRVLEHGRRPHHAGSHVQRADHVQHLCEQRWREGCTSRYEDRDRRDGIPTLVRQRALRRRQLVQLEGPDLLQRHDPDGHDGHARRALFRTRSSGPFSTTRAHMAPFRRVCRAPQTR